MSTTGAEVVDWYERKTESILTKYGPGPRVHFHIGLYDEELPAEADFEGIRRQLTTGQERLIAHAANRWNDRERLSGRVLDVGCGLGGGSIFWAQTFGAEVAALTIVPGHERIIRDFTAAAGVASRVTPVIADACAFEEPALFDAAVAFESVCYLDRRAWFRQLTRLIRPDGAVFVEDTFLEDPSAAPLFDGYWKTRAGSAAEYIEAARANGFTLRDSEDLTERTTHFWALSQEWIRHALSRVEAPRERERLRRSLEAHEVFRRMWRDRAITVRLLAFHRER